MLCRVEQARLALSRASADAPRVRLLHKPSAKSWSALGPPDEFLHQLPGAMGGQRRAVRSARVGQAVVDARVDGTEPARAFLCAELDQMLKQTLLAAGQPDRRSGRIDQPGGQVGLDWGVLLLLAHDRVAPDNGPGGPLDLLLPSRAGSDRRPSAALLLWTTRRSAAPLRQSAGTPRRCVSAIRPAGQPCTPNRRSPARYPRKTAARKRGAPTQLASVLRVCAEWVALRDVARS